MSQNEQEVDKWKTVYKEVRGAYDSRVTNLNSQQQRIANVLFANGLIFGFLGASAGIFFDSKVPKWPTSILYVTSMCSLALGLVAAVAALWPLIDPLSPSKAEQNTKQSGEPLRMSEPLFLSPSKAEQNTKQFSQFLKDLGKILSKPIAVLWNKIAPQRSEYTSDVGFFLDPEEILNAANLREVELLHKLSRSIVANVTHSKHIATFRFRRGWIRAQLVFIVSGILLLIAALITRLFIS